MNLVEDLKNYIEENYGEAVGEIYENDGDVSILSMLFANELEPEATRNYYVDVFSRNESNYYQITVTKPLSTESRFQTLEFINNCNMDIIIGSFYLITIAPGKDAIEFRIGGIAESYKDIVSMLKTANEISNEYLPKWN